MVLALQFSSPLYFETSLLLHAAKEALLLLTARLMSWRGREGLRQVFHVSQQTGDTTYTMQ